MKYHKGYNLDDTSLGHPNASKVKHYVSSNPRDLHVSPVTTQILPSTLHPSRLYGSLHV